MLQRVAACSSMLHRVAARYRALQCVAVRSVSVLQCVAVRCSALQFSLRVA